MTAEEAIEALCKLSDRELPELGAIVQHIREAAEQLTTLTAENRQHELARCNDRLAALNADEWGRQLGEAHTLLQELADEAFGVGPTEPIPALAKKIADGIAEARKRVQALCQPCPEDTARATLPELVEMAELECNAEHERAVQAETDRDEWKRIAMGRSKELGAALAAHDLLREERDTASAQCASGESAHAARKHALQDALGIAYDWPELIALAATLSDRMAQAREAFEAYGAARNGSAYEHDAYVDLRNALAESEPATPSAQEKP